MGILIQNYQFMKVNINSQAVATIFIDKKICATSMTSHRAALSRHMKVTTSNKTSKVAEGISPSCNCSVYKYVFDKNNDETEQNFPLGAALSDELEYLFGYSRQDGLLTQRIMNAWTNFAATGYLILIITLKSLNMEIIIKLSE